MSEWLCDHDIEMSIVGPLVGIDQQRSLFGQDGRWMKAAVWNMMCCFIHQYHTADSTT